MHDWMTAAKLSDLALCGLPSTKFGVIKKACREDWQSRPRNEKGGGREYHISSLPPEAKTELVRRLNIAEARAGQAAAKLVINSTLNGGQAQVEKLIAAARIVPTAKEKSIARAEIVMALKAYHEQTGLAALDARVKFADMYNSGEAAVAESVRRLIPSASSASLGRWQRKFDRDGAAGLADKYGNRKGSGLIDQDPALSAFIIGMLCEHPHVGAPNVMRGLRARFGRDGLPAYRTVQRFISRWKTENASAHAAITNPDRWRSKYQVGAGSQSEKAQRLNQVWEMDSTPADLLLADGRRYTIIGVIDIYSRRFKMLVSRTSKASAVTALVRRAMLDWGVPETIKTDNGSDYVSNHMRLVLDALEIDQVLCPPFTPEGKPHIERVFKTFQHSIVELAPGYIGHSVADRQDVEARKSFGARLGEKVTRASLTPGELQDFCDQWCDAVYHHDTHGSLGCTPFEKATAWRDPVRRIEDARALDILLSEAPGDGGMRTVGKQGIRFDHGNYIHPALGAHVGDRVRLLLDEADAGRVYVFDEDQRFICVAERPELTGVSRREIAAKKTAVQKAHMKDQKAALRAAKAAANTKHIAAEILRDRALEAADIVPFPARHEIHETPALVEAGFAARSGELTDAEPSPEEIAAHSEFVAGFDNVEEIRPEITDFDRALEILERIEGDADVAPSDRSWVKSYVKSTEFRSRLALRQSFESGGLS